MAGHKMAASQEGAHAQTMWTVFERFKVHDARSTVEIVEPIKVATITSSKPRRSTDHSSQAPVTLRIPAKREACENDPQTRSAIAELLVTPLDRRRSTGIKRRANRTPRLQSADVEPV
ncbi:hypothetical protein GCM10020219_026920 [Nonomuraea dietziae]